MSGDSLAYLLYRRTAEDKKARTSTYEFGVHAYDPEADALVTAMAA
ncbi:hypothetical protein [Streptomyces sp. BE133]|nr:hypothetical protein [Streptomyces sp. BE133]MEE1813361.1 hypothetical protein [Streptomyces sp. BE133]